MVMRKKVQFTRLIELNCVFLHPYVVVQNFYSLQLWVEDPQGEWSPQLLTRSHVMMGMQQTQKSLLAHMQPLQIQRMHRWNKQELQKM